MKYSKAVIFLIAVLLNSAAPVFSQEALGINYNQFLSSIQEQEINQVNATWVRGFLDMPLLGNQDPSQSPNIQAILEAKALGRRTILRKFSMGRRVHEIAIGALSKHKPKSGIERFKTGLKVKAQKSEERYANSTNSR